VRTWECPECGSNGPTDSDANRVVLLRTHQQYACPAGATVYDDTPKVTKIKGFRLPEFRPADGYVQRVERHQNMHRLFPDRVPEWTGTFRGRRA